MQNIPPHQQHLINEMAGLRKFVEHLVDGNQEAFGIVYYIKSTYKEWDSMLKWLKRLWLKSKMRV